MAKKKISTANEENDDWLKRINRGRFKRQDLEAHEDAAKTDKNKGDDQEDNDRT